MNGLRYIAKAFDRTPRLKRIIANCRDVARYAIELGRYETVFEPGNGADVDIIQLNEYKGVFCGYYDVSPFNAKYSNLLLLHGAKFGHTTKPTVKEKVDLLILDRRTGAYKLFARSAAWNWQQGARLQWLDDVNVVYNDYIGRVVVGKLYNTATGGITSLNENISIVTKDGLIITMDYNSLTKASEYGYTGMADTLGADSVIKRFDPTGVWCEELVDTRQLRSQYSAGERFHINHILPDPSGKKMVFLSRYWRDSRRWDSLHILKFGTGGATEVISNAVISHYAWATDNVLLVWAILADGAGYYFLNCENFELKFALGASDGHPNFAGPHLVVTEKTDSIWPRIYRLIIHDFNRDSEQTVLRISHPTVLDMRLRCDLHVSLSADAELYQVDSMHGGKRCIVVGALPSGLCRRAV